MNDGSTEVANMGVGGSMTLRPWSFKVRKVFDGLVEALDNILLHHSGDIIAATVAAAIAIVGTVVGAGESASYCRGRHFILLNGELLQH